MAATGAPRRKKNAAKNAKKSWRKNTDIDDVEEFLDDQRLEERLGGPFSDKSDAELFVVDTLADAEDHRSGWRAERKKRAREKPLKCLAHLEITTGVKDPKGGRNPRKTPEQRKNPTLVRKEEELRKAGVVKAKDILSKKHRMAQAAKKGATALERMTRRRTKFDFDLWTGGDLPEEQQLVQGKEDDSKDLEANEWIDVATKNHTLKNTGRLRRRLPDGYHKKPSDLPSVALPEGGTSYNPSYKDHQDLMFKAAMVELNKERQLKKIEFHTTQMFPSKSEAPTAQTWLKEMSEGLDLPGQEADENEDKEDDEELPNAADNPEDLEEDLKAALGPKTRQKRRKEKLLRMAEKRKLRDKQEKLKNLEVFRAKSLKKEIASKDKASAEKSVKKLAKLKAKRLEPSQLSGTKYEEPEIALKLSEEITGNLRNLKPESNLLEERFKSMQKRNVIEARDRHKVERNRRKRKAVEKRSYKMGFSWENK